MKESWLEKLIELLLNYEEEIKKSEWDYRYYWNMIDSLQLECRNVISSQILMREERWLILISKSYGFVQRLVENDKIDFDNRDLKDRFMNEFERYPQFQNNTTNREFNINGLLMLLSISDTPIDDLISYLK